jgi:hypothetical protein
VTLWGSVFGSFARPVSLNIGPSACNRTIWNSDSSMFVVTPQGTGTVKSLLLSMSQIQIETFLPDLSPIFKFDAPSMNALTSNGPPYDEQGQAVVTLFGSNFGASDVGWSYDQVSLQQLPLCAEHADSDPFARSACPDNWIQTKTIQRFFIASLEIMFGLLSVQQLDTPERGQVIVKSPAD